jgi:hypothetical protein
MAGVDALRTFLVGRAMPTAVDAVARERVEAFYAWMLETGYAAASVKNRHDGIRQFFAWCEEEGEVPEGKNRWARHAARALSASGLPDRPVLQCSTRDRGSRAGLLEDQDGCRLVDDCSHRDDGLLRLPHRDDSPHTVIGAHQIGLDETGRELTRGPFVPSRAQITLPSVVDRTFNYGDEHRFPPV